MIQCLCKTNLKRMKFLKHILSNNLSFISKNVLTRHQDKPKQGCYQLDKMALTRLMSSIRRVILDLIKKAKPGSYRLVVDKAQEEFHLRKSSQTWTILMDQHRASREGQVAVGKVTSHKTKSKNLYPVQVHLLF
jgi:hypothetical protein